MISLLIFEFHKADYGVEIYSTGPSIPNYLAPYIRPRNTPAGSVDATPSHPAFTAIRGLASASK